MILLGSLIPSAFLMPIPKYPLEIIDLNLTWQVPSLLLCALVCGPRVGVISSIAYLTIGLFHFPIFQNGGYLNYINEPGFGYLLGFIPAAWLSGKLSKQKGMNNIILLTLSAIGGLIMIHTFGLIFLLAGEILNKWQNPLPAMFYSYSLYPLSAQLTLCPAVGIISLILRRILFIK